MRRVLAVLGAVYAFAGLARAESVVVLPFFNVSKNASLDWVGESVSETVRDALASEGVMALDREERIEVYRRLSIRPYVLLTTASVMKIASALDAEQVVYGQFDLKPAANGQPLSKGSLEISAHLVDIKRMARGGDLSEVGALEDLAVLQRHLAWQTLRLVIPNSNLTETEFTNRHPAVRVDAIENYIRGLLASTPEEKHRFFTQAARLDANYSQPCFQIGKLEFANKDYRVAADWLQKVPPSDVHFREARFFLGLSLYHTGDFARAQNAFQVVAQIVPLNEVYNDIGAAQSRRNLPDAADSFKKALDGDPNDPVYQFNYGYALWKQSDFDRAAERFRAALQRAPQDTEAAAMLDRCLKHNGPRPGDTKTDRLERLKTDYEESAWWQLKAALQPQKP